MSHEWNAAKHKGRKTDQKCADSIMGRLKSMNDKLEEGDYRLKIMEVDGVMGWVLYHKDCPVNVGADGWYNPAFIVGFCPSTQVDG